MISKVEISHRTIFFTLATLGSLWLILQIRDILFLLFISFLLMTAIRPLVDALERLRLPRVVGILIIYAVVFGVFGLSIAKSIPALGTQSNRLAAALPGAIERVLPYWDIDVRTLSAQIAPIGEKVVRITVGLFSNLVTTLAVLVFTFYFLLERNHIRELLTNTMGKEAAERFMAIVRAIEKRLGAWVRGQLALMLIIGVAVYIGLTVLRVEFALPLAILAGLLEIIPIVGPIVSAIPAILVAMITSPLYALSVVALYFLIQQFENNLIVPWVMKRSVGLSPLVTIVTLMVGGKLAGMSGVVLAVPVLLVLQEVVGAYFGRSISPKDK